jgi:DNA-binding CsgD family transcriptional regulator
MAESLALRLARRLDRELDHVALREQASAVLRGSVGYDLAVWATLDPATVMWTSCVLDGAGRDEELETAVFRNEYLDADVLKLTDLADGPSRARCPEPPAAMRWRALEAATCSLRAGSTTSSGSSSPTVRRPGGRCACTAPAVASPTATSRRCASRPVLSRLCCATPCWQVPQPGSRPRSPRDAHPALFVCRPDGTVLRATAEAAALMGTTPEALLATSPVPVRSLVARHAAGLGNAAAAPAADGWLTLQATALGDDVVVVVEPIRSHQLADLVVRSRALTPRELEVLALVARGRSNRQIASALGLSEWTVQDHVKALLAKFEVTSRGELVASLFFEHLAPGHSSH